MPDSCAASRCSNERSVETKTRGVTFHRFPREPDLKKDWESAVRREGFVATGRSLLCSEHFTAADFDRTGQTVRLRAGVKPSVFNFPSHLQKVQLRVPVPPSGAAELRPLASQHPEVRTALSDNVKQEHSYALPVSASVVKKRLREALTSLERLQRQRRNSLIRERRAKRTIRALQEDLREKNLVNKKLKDQLHSYSGSKKAPV